MTLKNASRYEYEFAFESGLVYVGAEHRRIDGTWTVAGDSKFEVFQVPEDRVDEVAAKVADYVRRHRELVDQTHAVSDEFRRWSHTFTLTAASA